MEQRQPRQITLGQMTWTVRPLTVRQMREIEPLAANIKMGQTLDAAMKVIAVALSRDNAGAVSALDDLEATPDEVNEAMNAVLHLGGFIKDEAKGEAVAPASTGASLSAE